MNYFEFPSSELEKELISLDTAEGAEDEDDNEVQEQEQEQNHLQEKEEDDDTGGETLPTIQSNTVGLFGPGVSEFWVKKKTGPRKKRVRRGLTSGMHLPENVQQLLGMVRG